MAISSTDYDVVIVGAGLIGISLALKLKQQDLRIALVENKPFHPPQQNIDLASNLLKPDGRASALAFSSLQLLRQIHLHKTIETYAQPIWDIRVCDGHAMRGLSKLFLHFSHHESEVYIQKNNDPLQTKQDTSQSQLDKPSGINEPLGAIIDNNILRNALLQAASNLEVIAPAKVIGFTNQSDIGELVLESGVHENLTTKTIKARLVVACDGARSTLRDLAAINYNCVDYKQTAIVCTLQHKHDHNGTAVELFLPSGPFAMLPMTNRRSSIVWSERTDLAKHFLNMPKAHFMAFLKERFGDWLGDIELVSQIYSYPIHLVHAQRYYAKNLVLVGDAAHSIHPIAGQGLNLGLRDVACLAGLLAQHTKAGLRLDSELLLQTYQRQRLGDNIAIITATDQINRLFSNDCEPIRHARNAGLALVQMIPQLRRSFMHNAMGVSHKV